MTRLLHRPSRPSACGFSLIELLVVLVLLSIGLLGMVGLQARAVQISVGAEDSAHAALLASDIAARMWVERTVSLPAAAIEDWNDRVGDVARGGLPEGQGRVDVSDGVATIRVVWRGPDQAASSVYQTQVQLP
jgi:type IV pilus assembly protein PilV